MDVPFLRTPYNYDMNAAGDESGLACLDLTRAQQQFKDECDINTIVERFGLTGQLPAEVRMPLEGDFTEVVDYQTGLNMIRSADEAFMTMPAYVRERFGNDPARFVSYASDPANVADMRLLGLARPLEPDPGPLLVRVVPEPPPAPSAPS